MHIIPIMLHLAVAMRRHSTSRATFRPMGVNYIAKKFCNRCAVRFFSVATSFSYPTAPQPR